MVVLITITARQVAPAHGDEVSENRMTAREQPPANKACLAQFELQKLGFSHLLACQKSDRLATIYSGVKTGIRRICDDCGITQAAATSYKDKGALVFHDRAPSLNLATKSSLLQS